MPMVTLIASANFFVDINKVFVVTTDFKPLYNTAVQFGHPGLKTYQFAHSFPTKEDFWWRRGEGGGGKGMGASRRIISNNLTCKTKINAS